MMILFRSDQEGGGPRSPPWHEFPPPPSQPGVSAFTGTFWTFQTPANAGRYWAQVPPTLPVRLPGRLPGRLPFPPLRASINSQLLNRRALSNRLSSIPDDHRERSALNPIRKSKAKVLPLLALGLATQAGV